MIRGLAAASVAAGWGCSGAGTPSLERAEPAAARRGDTIALFGAGFCVPDCETSPIGAVNFGIEIPSVRGVVLSWDATTIAVVVPQNVDLGPTEILVTVNDRSSNALDFEVLP